MQISQFSIKETFGVDAPAAAAVKGFAAGHTFKDYVPDITPHYVFRKELLRDVLGWMSTPDGDGLYLAGPTGAGKTSVVMEATGRLNWPTLCVSGHGRLEMHDLVGHQSIGTDKSGNQQMRFVHGPLAIAMREGFVFILDEIDLLDPSVSTGLNAVLEGRPLVIPENAGEIIRPHPNFRFVATGNSAGQGDESGLHAGVQQQNIASMDRFVVLQVGYMDADVEVALLQKVLAGVDEKLVRSMVNVANMIRKQFIGNVESTERGTLSVTMSTRTLIRWAKKAGSLAKAGAPHPLKYAFERSFSFRTNAFERMAIHKICHEVFGSAWDGTV